MATISFKEIELVLIDGIFFKRILNSNDRRELNYFKAKKEGNLYLHQYLWEKHNNQKVPDGSVVHHIDFNPLNNSLDNLQMLTIEEHTRIHKMEEWKKKKIKEDTCMYCQKKFMTRTSQSRPHACSEECRKKHYIKKINCAYCGKEVVKRKDSKATFCDFNCSNKGINKSKRSKDFMKATHV